MRRALRYKTWDAREGSHARRTGRARIGWSFKNRSSSSVSSCAVPYPILALFAVTSWRLARLSRVSQLRLLI